MKLTKLQTRNLAIRCQLLDGSSPSGSDADSVYRVIQHLGYVQIDTISVVERAHHHTLWSRCPDFTPRMLDVLLAKERRIFEYWGHLASYLPLSNYRFYLPYMQKFPWHSTWTRNLWEKHKEISKEVYARIKAEGPLSSRDFTTPETKRSGWWDWKPAKTALELLLWRGDLMVKERHNFQRVYDLTERVLPPHTDTRMPSEEELGEFFVRRALGANGLATRREIITYMPVVAKAIVEATLKKMLEAGEVINLQVEGDEKTEYFGLTAVLEAELERRKKKILHILSPFDNFTINRDRLARLFGYSYQLECYTPQTKRKYGYFSLPILWGEKLVGRMDAKAERKQKRLVVKNLVLEDGFKPNESFIIALKGRLRDYARFNGCETISVERCEPVNLIKQLAAL